ncbi:MAG: class I SAM-dependent methyltransferase [Actinomycetota bacterium]
MAADERADLRSYYEAEARADLRPYTRSTRHDLQQRFVDRVIASGATSVLDIGAGPGRDRAMFAEAGIAHIGCDLAMGNARLAAAAGSTVIPADVHALPFRPKHFGAGWCMSVLMHFDAGPAEHAFAELVACLRHGAPLCVALWGADQPIMYVDQKKIPGERRPFYHRDVDTNRRMFERHASVDDVEVFLPDAGQYQVFHLRA